MRSWLFFYKKKQYLATIVLHNKDRTLKEREREKNEKKSLHNLYC